MKNLKNPFHGELMDMYDVEHRIVNGLPKLAKAVTSSGLQSALLKHLTKTKSARRRSGSMIFR